eukprot:NODE_100_length_20331_cov_1.214462.p15 type:complete len:211 gc:universal NODE_100_length_20331_cov_1.214462:17030-17662(+)
MTKSTRSYVNKNKKTSSSFSHDENLRSSKRVCYPKGRNSHHSIIEEEVEKYHKPDNYNKLENEVILAQDYLNPHHIEKIDPIVQMIATLLKDSRMSKTLDSFREESRSFYKSEKLHPICKRISDMTASLGKESLKRSSTISNVSSQKRAIEAAECMSKEEVERISDKLKLAGVVPCLEERFDNLEKAVLLNENIPIDIFKRLKRLEDLLL